MKTTIEASEYAENVIMETKTANLRRVIQVRRARVHESMKKYEPSHAE